MMSPVADRRSICELTFGDQEVLIAHMHGVLDEPISAPLGA
jgi:hypothetical protein